MFKSALAVCVTIACTSSIQAQDVYYGQPGAYQRGYTAMPVNTGDFQYTGYGSIGSGEPLYAYDDLEPWKHGYLHIMPYYEGYHSFRPYNYKQVLSQSQTAAAWGMPNTMPYSQQFWHRYEQQADLSVPRTAPQQAPAPHIDLYQSGYSAAPTSSYARPGQVFPIAAPVSTPQQFAAPAARGAASPQAQALRQYMYGGPQLP